MPRDLPSEHDLDVLRQVRELLYSRYGHARHVRRAEFKVSVREAGYAITGGWWSVEAALSRCGTSFHTEDVQTRLDWLIFDVLTDPAEPTSAGWAYRYGYVDPGSAARGLRTRFGVSLGYVRRIGTVGQWLSLARRQPRAGPGQARREEAVARIAVFADSVRLPVPPLTRWAVERLGTDDISLKDQERPRYPAMSVREAGLVEGVREQAAV